ncbi:MAG: MFS transporter, partial [Solirubrobacterales bacterium]
SPIHFGLAFVVGPALVALGSTIGQAVTSKGGVRQVAVVGMALGGLGCLLLTKVSVEGNYLEDVLPGLMVFGAGLGAAYVAGSISSLTGVTDADAGVASGLNNASFQIGGAVGVAILSTVAVSGAGGSKQLTALTAGYQSAFAVAGAFAAVGLTVALLLLGQRQRPAAAPHAEPSSA